MDTSFEKALETLYTKPKNELEVYWENLTAPKLSSLITNRDLYDLNKIATSVKLSSKPKEKYNCIDEILTKRDFKYLASGTNRVAYKSLENQDIILKIAFDKVGLKDSPAEYLNQYEIKGNTSKVFEVSECGTVGLFERLVPIINRKQFESVADWVYYIITNNIIGKYVIQDIGSDYFQNYGLRPGFGPALLDFPYLYKLDGNKLLCNRKDDSGNYCLGAIDYDIGFNNIVCTKCGKRYLARELAKDIEDNNIINSKRGENIFMKVRLIRDGKVISQSRNETPEASYIPDRRDMNKFIPKRKNYDNIASPTINQPKVPVKPQPPKPPKDYSSNVSTEPVVDKKPQQPPAQENKTHTGANVVLSLTDEYIENIKTSVSNLKNILEVIEDPTQLTEIVGKINGVENDIKGCIETVLSTINNNTTDETKATDTTGTNENTSVENYNVSSPIPNPDIIQSQQGQEHPEKNELNNSSKCNPVEIDNLRIITTTSSDDINEDESSIMDEY